MHYRTVHNKTLQNKNEFKTKYSFEIFVEGGDKILFVWNKASLGINVIKYYYLGLVMIINNYLVVDFS